MLNRFEKVWQEIVEDLNISIPEEEIEKKVNVASMIEKEAVVDSERSFISSVIYNRIAIEMPLQIDATVIYSYGYHIEKIINCKEFDKKKNERYVYDLNKILDLHKKLSTGIEKIKKDFDNDKSSLTKREREIALLAQRGITTKEISKRLFISTETVKMTLKKVYRKLDVHSKAELNTVKF